jgi:hypothetical protein
LLKNKKNSISVWILFGDYLWFDLWVWLVSYVKLLMCIHASIRWGFLVELKVRSKIGISLLSFFWVW